MTKESRSSRWDAKATAFMAVSEARVHLILGLAPYVDREMKKHVGTNWLDHARNRRSPDAGPSSLDEAVAVADVDDIVLLRTIVNFWVEAFKKGGLKDIHKGLVTTCIAARNASSHPTSRLLEPEAAWNYLVAIQKLLEAIGDQEGSTQVLALKSRINEPSASGARSEEIKYEMHAMEQRIRDGFKEEAEARSKAGSKAGQEIIAQLVENSKLLQEIHGILKQTPSPVVQKVERPLPATANEPQVAGPANWQLRRNANGSIGAVGTTRDGQGVRRLVFTPADARNLLPTDLVDQTWHAQGGWVAVPPTIVDRLESELARRLTA